MSESRFAQARARLRDFLFAQRNPDGGWPYHASRQSRIEPTAWAMLALRIPAEQTPLLRWADREGLLVEPAIGTLNFAFNGVAALALHATGSAVAAAATVSGLLAHKGVRIPDSPLIRQDGSLQAWAWTEGTFTWVEPTAWCLLAVKKVADRRRSEVAARIDEAERVLADRACPGGGWNAGNSMVYGTPLLAYVPPTAVALLALQDVKDLPVARDAARYLTAAAPREGSTSAAALASLAYQALHVADDRITTVMLDRVDMAQEFGNVAHAAMLLYALECRAAGTPPSALTLG